VSADLVTLTIDGKEVTVPKGTLIIRAAEELGIEIPRFCEHPLLSPIGACRQCYVEVEGQRKLFTSCTTPVAPEMVVHSQNTSEEAHRAQVANLEFLLLNHPLDCPICDRGGECPLQDQALAFGPGESRYIEPKRTYEKPIALSPLVSLDRERCVLCTRCTRFCDEISGDRFIELYARGAGERVSIAPGEDFRSPFSGNTVQICPVGALTSTPYRFVARPFDLRSADTVCPHCSSGCNIKLDVRRGQVVRHLARDNYDVNDAWLCDKGRYAFRFAEDPDRLTTPMLRARGLEPASFGEVFGWIAERTRGRRVAFLTGGRLTDEDYYALSKLARVVFRTNDLDHRRTFNGGHAEEVAAATRMQVTYGDVERASAILVVGLDAEQESPILHLRIRKAARRGARVFVVHPRRTRLDDLAEHVLARPGHEAAVLEEILDAPEAADTPAARIASALRAADGNVVVLTGGGVTEHPLGADVALRVANAFRGRFALVPRRANDRGALRAGVHPALLPGGRRAGEASERGAVEAVWGELPAEPGRDAEAILRAAADHEIDILFLIGVDPVRDFPDAELVRRALGNVGVKVVQSLELGELETFADAVLPAAAYLEKDGHYTDWEGRGQRLRPVRGPVGIARPDWQIFAGLAEAMGTPLGFETLEELQEEMAGLLAPREVPMRSDAYAGTGRPQYLEELTLFSYPLLVDEGRQVEGAAELKAALQDPPFAEMHPEDAEKHDVADADRVALATRAGRAEVELRVTTGVAVGTVFVPFNQPGLAANTLLSGRFTAAVEVGRATASSSEAVGGSTASSSEAVGRATASSSEAVGGS
jgi:NADH-quinone oxidoreductase subunit G